MKNQSRSLLVQLLLCAGAVALSPLEALESYTDLSAFYSLLSNTNSTNFSSVLSASNGFTLLAPSNDALQKYLATNPTRGELDATLNYALLNGSYPALSFKSTPQFVDTSMRNVSFANVTGGQRIELWSDAEDTPQVVSGNKTVGRLTTEDIICVGGIIHIVDQIPIIPLPTVLEVSAAQLQYFVSILTTGNYLSNAANAAYVDAELDVPDVTYFIPNSATALSNFQTLVENSTAEELQAAFLYHVITGFVGYSPYLEDGMKLTTAEGSNVTISIQGDDVFVNAAKIIATDYLVANGVVHVIDDLLDRFNTSLPSSPTTSAIPSPTAKPTSPTPTPTIVSTVASHSTTGLSTGAIVGIAVGASVGGLLILALIIWRIVQSRKHRRELETPIWNDRRQTSGGYYGSSQRSPDPSFLQTGEVKRMVGDVDPMRYAVPYDSTAERPNIPARSPGRLR